MKVVVITVLSQPARIVDVFQPFMTTFSLNTYFSIYLRPRSTCGMNFYQNIKNNKNFVFDRKKGQPFGTTALYHTQPSEANNLKARELCGTLSRLHI